MNIFYISKLFCAENSAESRSCAENSADYVRKFVHHLNVRTF